MKEFSVENSFSDRSIPFYYQIANMLRQKIEQGVLAPGEKLPKEIDLSKAFGVSRVTLRQSLSILEEEGLLIRGRGQGTFVAENVENRQKIKLTGIIGQDDSHVEKRRILSIDNVAPTAQQAEFFDISKEDRVTRIQRLLLSQKKPFSYVNNYLSTQMAKKITKTDILNRSMVNIISKKLRIPIGKIHQTFEARSADNEVANHLSVGIMDPVLYVETFVYGKKKEPIEFSQIYYRGNQHIYSIELLSDGNII